MPLVDNHVSAILRAQFLTVRNRTGSSAILFWALSLVWYGAVAVGAWGIASVLPHIRILENLSRIISGGLLLAFLGWQILPLLLVSAGVTLDLRRLLVYPIPTSRLFVIEVLLRVTTGTEVLILLAGGAVGLWLHPAVPWYGPLFLLPFVLFNMLLSAGVRDLLTRLLARRGVREVVVFGIVLLAALPQLIVVLFPPETWRQQHFTALFDKLPPFPWPWQVAAGLALGHVSVFALAALTAWTVVGGWFGYRQFQKGLAFDADATRARERGALESAASTSWKDALYRLPSRLLPDPLAAIVEKEIRSLTRTARFRLVFFMGFTFGLIIWLPLLLKRGAQSGGMSDHFLVWVSLYAALLLGEVLFLNVFGFDRLASQAWYIMPVSVTRVLIGKNITAVFFLLLEIAMVAAACALLRLPVTPARVVECFAVTLLLCLFLLSAGNLCSTHFPRPINPDQSWRNASSGKVQFILLGVYPLIGIPIALAYLARYAFETQFSFYAVLLSGFVVAGITYYVALQSSVEAAEARREAILASLGRTDGPMGG